MTCLLEDLTQSHDVDLHASQAGAFNWACSCLHLYRLLPSDGPAGRLQVAEHERGGIPHHMLDILDPSDEFSAGDFYHAAREAAADILQVPRPLPPSPPPSPDTLGLLEYRRRARARGGGTATSRDYVFFKSGATGALTRQRSWAPGAGSARQVRVRQRRGHLGLRVLGL